MLLALSSGHKIGLGVAAAVFILFAILSALVVPRWRPEFPGRLLRVYVLAVVLLFAGMLAAVFVFGKEGESEGEAATATQSTAEGTTTAAAGNAVAGKQVFDSSGCASCHTFREANATGTVGPNLDTALEGKDTDFIRTSILQPNAEIAEGYPPNVMPQDFGDQLSDEQLSNVVAFLAQAT